MHQQLRKLTACVCFCWSLLVYITFMSQKSVAADGGKNSWRTVELTIDHISRFVNISNTPLQELIQAGPDLLKSHVVSYSLYDIPKLSTADDDFASAVRDTFRRGLAAQYAASNSSVVDDWSEDAEDKERGPVRGTQVRGYEGCRRDYGSLAEPFTDRIQRTVHKNLCEDPKLPGCDELGPVPPAIYKKRIPGPYSFRMFDALAKIESGLQEGKIHWVGSYEMCYKINTQYNYTNTSYQAEGIFIEERELAGKYCRLRLTPKTSENSSSTPLRLIVGLCVPDTCSRKDVYRYIMEENLVFEALMDNVLGVNVTDVYCGQQDFITPEIDSEATAVKAVLYAIYIIIILATIYDAYFRKPRIRQQYPNDIPQPTRHVSLMKPIAIVDENEDKDEKVSKMFVERLKQEKPTLTDRIEMIFVGFSAYSNCRRIFTSRLKEGHFDCLNGVRTLSFAYYILGCTYLYGPVVTEMFCISNLVTKLRTFPQTLGAQAILNFHFNVDSFLVLSGFLTCYWWLKRHKEVYKEKFTIGMIFKFILHKYWRIMPLYIFSLAYFTATYRYSERSPFYPQQSVDFENCKEGQWWRNLLLVNNLVDTDYACISWSWYLPLVFQLQLFSLFILIPLIVKPTVGYIMLTISYLVHLGVAVAVAYQTYGDFGAWYADFLQTPWCRAGAFLIGMALGIIIYRSKASIKVPLVAAIIGWLIAIGAILTVTFSTYSQWENQERWSRGATAIYDTLGRTTWALGVAWVIFACINGCGGLANSFLSWKAFMPLSKLVYSALLVHANVIYFWIYSQFTLIYLSDINLNYMFFGHIMISYIYGFITIALLQYPISIGIERAISCKNKLGVILAGRNPLHLSRGLVGDEKEKKRNIIDGGKQFDSSINMRYAGSSNAAYVPDGSKVAPPDDNKLGGSSGFPGYVQVHEMEYMRPETIGSTEGKTAEKKAGDVNEKNEVENTYHQLTEVDTTSQQLTDL